MHSKLHYVNTEFPLIPRENYFLNLVFIPGIPRLWVGLLGTETIMFIINLISYIFSLPFLGKEKFSILHFF